jgi:AcrR family transcriptional regulator
VSVLEITVFFSEGDVMGKSDARVRYTQRVIKESFLMLLRNKPVNKITVKEVCELAELNRATFYAHYSDCFALKESIEQELLDAFGQSLIYLDGFDVSVLIEAIYKMVETYENACRVLIFGGASPSLIGRMIELAKASSIEVWKKQLHHATDAEIEMLYTHLSNGLMNVVVDGYDRYRRDEVISFVNRIVRSSLSLFR